VDNETPRAALTDPRNNALITRGRPFEKGNAGRPKGARHKVTRAVEALLEGEAEELTRKAIELAKGGDLTAIRICLDRIAPPRKDRHIEFDLPKMETAKDAASAGAAIIEALSQGELTPSEAGELVRMVESYARTLQTSDFEARLERLEKERGMAR
jgi:hypothetical protein